MSILRARALALELHMGVLYLREVQSAGQNKYQQASEFPHEAEWGARTLSQGVVECSDHLDRAIDGLDAELRESEFEIGGGARLEAGEFWSLGTIRLAGEPRPIHAGFLEPVLQMPFTGPIPERVVAYLTQIEGYEDLLKRERHDHFGFHYHYLDAKERSDVILCWDTRAAVSPKQKRPLFHEKHGERYKGFRGRPDLWGPDKRQSMHAACEPDLAVWHLSEFKKPKRSAISVWPVSAVLTAVPVSHHSTAPRFPSKKHMRGAGVELPHDL